MLEPLSAYLLIAQKQYGSQSVADNYNVGPDNCDCINTENLVKLFCDKWGDGAGYDCHADDESPHEAAFLRLDSSRIRMRLRWKPRLHIDDCMELTCDFYKSWLKEDDFTDVMDSQIRAFFGR